MLKYCPHCRVEYFESARICNDCKTALVKYEDVPPRCPSCKETYSFQESYCEKCLVDLDIFQKEENENLEQQMSDKPPEFVEMMKVYETRNQQDEIPHEHAKEFIEYEEVLSTFNPGDIAFIKSILDSEGIIYYFQGEHFNYVRPLVEPAKLMVEKDQVETAKELLKDANLTFMAINLDDDSRKEEEPE
jgi:hypothetical protein